MLGKVHGAKQNVIMNVPLVDVGCDHILVFAAEDFIGKLFADLMGFLIVHFSRRKGLYQMVRKIVPLVHGLLAGKLKLNIRRFNGAAKGGHQQLFVRLCRVGDIVQRLL